MVVVGTNGELLNASTVHRLALTKTPNVEEAFAWKVELIDDDRGRRESQQKRIEGKSNFQRWLTDWVDTSKRDWQASCGMFQNKLSAEDGVFVELEFFRWDNPSQFKGYALGLNSTLHGMSKQSHKQANYYGLNVVQKETWYMPISASFIKSRGKIKNFSDAINASQFYGAYGNLKEDALHQLYNEVMYGQLSDGSMQLYLLGVIEMLAAAKSMPMPKIPKDILQVLQSMEK